MRKLIMWNLITLDGYFEGEKNWDLPWGEQVWGDELERFCLNQLQSAGMRMRRPSRGRLTLPDYEKVAFKRLTQICADSIIELMNDPTVREHLPLARGHFGAAECESFVALKERMWEDSGFGPWAFVLDDEFIGWGGLQPEGDDVDLGLVLSRKHWGAGPVLYRRILTYAFEELDVDSVIALLPPSRTRVAALRRLGFREDGEILIEDQRFVRYRLIRGNRRP